MALILPETDYTLHDARLGIQNNLNFAYTEVHCCNCGFDMKIPLMVKASDVRRLNSLIEMVEEFVRENPAIEKSLMEKLMDKILDWRNANGKV